MNVSLWLLVTSLHGQRFENRVHRGKFCGVTVKCCVKHTLEACTCIKIAKMMTVAAVLEMHNRAVMSQFPIKLCKNKNGGMWEI